MIVLRDCFVSAKTWYVVGLNEKPFFERIILPFSFLGLAFLLWQRDDKAHLGIRNVPRMPNVTLIKTFILSLFILTFVMVSISGAYPGARRLVIILPFFYWLAALSIYKIFRQPLLYYLCIGVLVVYMVLSVFSLYRESFWTYKNSCNSNHDVLYDVIRPIISRANVIINKDQVGTQYGGEQYLSYMFMENYFNLYSKGIKSLYVIDNNGDMVTSCGNSIAKESVYLSTDSLDDAKLKDI